VCNSSESWTIRRLYPGEMAATIPALGAIAVDKPKIGLVHERRCLQSLAWLFLGQSMRRQFTKFVVYQRQQLLSGS
jgi:hypothetical protein